jgi:hypothetical protein
MAYFNNPLLLFGGLVSLSAVPAAVLLLYTVYERWMFGIWHSGYALLGAILMFLAIQGAAMSLMSLMTKRSENKIMKALRETIR